MRVFIVVLFAFTIVLVCCPFNYYHFSLACLFCNIIIKLNWNFLIYSFKLIKFHCYLILVSRLLLTPPLAKNTPSMPVARGVVASSPPPSPAFLKGDSLKRTSPPPFHVINISNNNVKTPWVSDVCHIINNVELPSSPFPVNITNDIETSYCVPLPMAATTLRSLGSQ
jgi:hypothetical protein